MLIYKRDGCGRIITAVGSTIKTLRLMALIVWHSLCHPLAESVVDYAEAKILKSGCRQSGGLNEAQAKALLDIALDCLLKLVQAQPGLRYTQLLNEAIDQMLKETDYTKEHIKLALALALLQLIVEGYVVIQNRQIFLPSTAGGDNEVF